MGGTASDANPDAQPGSGMHDLFTQQKPGRAAASLTDRGEVAGAHVRNLVDVVRHELRCSLARGVVGLWGAPPGRGTLTS